MKRYAVFFAFALLLLLPTTVAAAECQFILGFKTLRDLVGHDIVGECLENEHHGENGDSLQQTTGGLLVWRKADNWTAFTDGYRSWINGPNGLEQRLNTERFPWEYDFVAPATPTPVPDSARPPIPASTRTPAPVSIPTRATHTTRQAIEGLSWVRNGVTSREDSVVQNLQSLATNSENAFWELMGKLWIHDGVSVLEMLAVDSLTAISRSAAAASLQIATMPFLESIDAGDVGTLIVLNESANRRVLQGLLADATLGGIVTEHNRAEAVLLYLETQDPQAAATLRSMPWVQDGITAVDAVSAYTLQSLALSHRTTFQALVRKSWFQDGLSEDEHIVIQRLLSMNRENFTRRDEAAVLRIIEMPFLDAVDGADVAALEALARLFWAPERSLFYEVLAYPTLRDGITDDQAVLVSAYPTLRDGITDDQAVLVSALSGVLERSPDLIKTMLDPRQVMVWKRTLNLGVYGAVDLAVVSTSQEASSNLDWLEHAVRSHVTFMGTPLPRSFVGLWVHDKGGGGGGPTGILNIGEYRNPSVVAHETAHIYWPFYPPWIAEGAAVFLQGVSENARIGTAITPFARGECQLTATLSGLDRLAQERGDNLQGCEYSLGFGLFVDLYRSLGDQEFRQGFRTLYVQMRDNEHLLECTGLEKGLCYIKAAFVTNASPQSAQIAEPIVNRWYYGSDHGGR